MERKVKWCLGIKDGARLTNPSKTISDSYARALLGGSLSFLKYKANRFLYDLPTLNDIVSR